MEKQLSSLPKYYVGIHSTTNVISDPKFFFGTGFLGEPFSTKEELKNAILEYGTFVKDGVKYMREEMRLTFSLADSINAIKADGDKQCKEYGEINLLKAVYAARHDPFKDIEILYRPSEWEDAKGNSFKFILIKDGQIIPKNMKLSEILKELGMQL